MTSRRGFLLGLGSSIIASPAIVRASSLMAIKPVDEFLADYLHTQIELSYSITRDRLRDLLMPGLQRMAVSYAAIPTQWDRVLAQGAP